MVAGGSICYLLALLLSSTERTSLSLLTFMHWRRKWQPTPVFLPGESQGRGSLVGCRLWGRTELDTTEATQQQQQQPCCLFGEASHFCSFYFHGWKNPECSLIFILPPFSSNLYPFSLLIPLTDPLKVNLNRVRKHICIWSHKFSKASLHRMLVVYTGAALFFKKKNPMTYLL